MRIETPGRMITSYWSGDGIVVPSATRSGLGKSMIYRLIQEGKFPAPYKVSPAAARWSERERVAWIDDVKDGFEGKSRRA